uniref:Protein Wnt n=1 Tax=Globodera pallida TaxID=36090 RepID=A0A183CT79_GLOPA
LALRYCSPLYQRLRHSVQSLSSALFQHSNSTRDLRQYAMDGPGSSSRQC